MTTAYEKVKKWRVANPERWKKARREYNKRNRVTVSARQQRYIKLHSDVICAQRTKRTSGIRCLIDEIKVSIGCCFCGENFPAALDFHHVGEKNGTVACFSSRSFAKAKKEIDKCILICANCHRKLHVGFLSLDE